MPRPSNSRSAFFTASITGRREPRTDYACDKGKPANPAGFAGLRRFRVREGGLLTLRALGCGFDGFGRRVAERELATVGEADLGGAGTGVAVAGLEGLDD